MKVIVFAAPVFLLLIALEFAYGLARKRNTYQLSDMINSISLGMLSQISAVFTRALRVGIYALVATHVALVPHDAAQAFWTTWYGWILALVFYDFCYYWLHRAGHECAVFWAAHVVHHQSQKYNLSTALRQTSSGVLFGWVFYMPMALAGVPLHVFAVVGLVDLLYQFWVHTEHVGRLGWFDRWFCSPSNHRVHHATNAVYLDRNYGGIWVIWDRMFGSFKEEDEAVPCMYGTRKPLNSWDPVWANAEVYGALMRDSWQTKNWGDKLRVWLKPPGWRPADVSSRFPAPAFDEETVVAFNPPLSAAQAKFAFIDHLVLLGLILVFMWFGESLPWPQALAGLLALTASMWALGAAMQHRIGIWQCVGLQLGALAMVAMVFNVW